MSDHTFFSVVVPTYNRCEILIKTLTSILKQNFKDFEVIVVNDGSTDNTLEIIIPILKEEPRIKLISQKNKERGAARNFGYENSFGDYVVFFDSDDLMHENHLTVLYKNIQEQNFPLFIATKFDFFNEDGLHYKSDISKLKQGNYDYKLFLNGNPLACNICIKKDNPGLILFEEDRRFSIKEDWLFMLQNLHQHKLFIVDLITISMFDHADRSMRSDNKLIIQRTQLAFDRIVEKIRLSSSELNELRAHVSYFCGIHSYLDNNRNEGINYIKTAIKFGGLRYKYISLFLKTLAGRKLIRKLK